jgi:rod shape-determining protein MreD
VSTFAKLAGLALAAILLQALAREIFPGWLRPDPVLVFALALGLHGRGTPGLVLAFGSGFAVDALSGSPPGLFALLRGTACMLTRAVDHALYLRAALPWALFVFGYTIFDGLALGLCQRVFLEGGALPWSRILLEIPGSALASGLLAAPLLPLLLRLDADPAREAGLALSSRP